MYRNCALIGLACSVLSVAGTASGAIWTETFDDGVGRFNITRGQGDTLYVYDPVDQDLSATFVVQPQPHGRYASLGASFTEQDVFSYSVKWTPLSGTGMANLGFRSASYAQWIGVNIRSNKNYSLGYNNGVDSSPVLDLIYEGFPSWAFGNSYRIDLTIDGPNSTIVFTTSRLVGNDFILQDTITWSIATVAWQIDRVGMFNHQDPGPATFTMDIDNWAFVPEPASLSLLAVGALSLIRRRRK